MYDESSDPSPCVLTLHSLVRVAGSGTGTLGCLGEGLMAGRGEWDEAAAPAKAEASRVAHRENFIVAGRVGKVTKGELRASAQATLMPRRSVYILRAEHPLP